MRSRIVEYLNQSIGIDLFGWLIPTPPVIYAIAFLLVVWVFARRCQAVGLEKGVALDIGLSSGIAGIVMSRLVYVLFYQDNFPANFKSLLSAGGTASWGVYGGAFIGAYLLLRFKKRPVLQYLDVLAATLPLGTFIGRWSCFMHGCDYGTITGLPWGVRYPVGSPAHAAHVNNMLVDPTAQLSLPVHPNQIYLSLNALLIFGLVTWFWKRYRTRPGLTLGFYVAAYCTTRFLLEFFRDTPGSGLIPTLNPPQVICIIGVALSLLFIYGRSLHQNLKANSVNNLKINKNVGEQKHV